MLRRWLIFGLALMLLMLCLAAWGGSYWRLIGVSHTGKTFLAFALNSGRVLINWGSGLRNALGWDFVNADAFSWDAMDKFSKFSWLGFSSGNNTGWPYFTIPLWFPSLLSLFFLWFTWRKTRRKSTGKAFPIEASIEAKSPSA
jgi:hypothetical protein